GRSRLFDILKTWAYEHPFVFIGHSLQDPDIRAVLLELTSIGDFRPRYYVIAPDVDEIKRRYWESKKITALEGSFDTFMTTLSARWSFVRELAAVASRPQHHPIESKFRSHSTLSQSTLDFLGSDVAYVNSIVATEEVNAVDFYKGFSQGFG